MYLDDIRFLRCPACGGDLGHEIGGPDPRLPPGVDPRSMAWEGRLVCSSCGRGYPLLEGVACLAILDRRWSTPLRETESRLAMAMRTADSSGWEPGRAETYERQEQSVHATMEHLFTAALNEIDFSDHPLVLDLGAGECRTSEAMIDRGARVIALDADLARLRYLSFESIDALPPECWRHPRSGHVYHFKDPRPLRSYFTRLFANIDRLPFAAGTFDLVFCRSVLHHLADHGRTMREMARVLKPGGRMVFCSEPVRSPLEREADCVRGCVHIEEGMHERVWPLWHYLTPIRGLARAVMVQTWPNPPSRRLRRLAPLLAGWLARRIGPGARVSGWRLAALTLCSASVNIFATRNGRPVAPPGESGPALQESGPDQLADFAELFRVRPGQIAQGVEDLPRKRAAVNALRRRLAAGDASLTDRLWPARQPSHALDRGWLAVEDREDRRGRRAAREASCMLARQGDMLTVSAFWTGRLPGRIGLWVNDRFLAWQPLQPGRWQVIRAPLPSSPEGVCSVRLVAEPDGAAPVGSGGEAPALIVECIATGRG